jgi:hypothetical protein
MYYGLVLIHVMQIAWSKNRKQIYTKPIYLNL